MKTQIPNKIVTINDKDAPWVNSSVKNILRKNKIIYTDWIKKGRNPLDRERVKRSQLITNRKINEAKTTYISKLSHKLCDPATGQKSFWSAYKRLSNKKKITNIPPLFENNKYISNFKEKTSIFNKYFAEQCRPLEN